MTRWGRLEWMEIGTVPSAAWQCGYCDCHVASEKGWVAGQKRAPFACIRICPQCQGPSFFYDHDWVVLPRSLPAQPVSNVPSPLDELYQEARESVKARAYTGAVLICRKMLMNIAVHLGAPENLSSFVKYVDYLADAGYVPPGARPWIDYIRARGNEATHEVQLMGQKDAEGVLTFIENLLRQIYEIPSKLQVPNTE